MKVRWSRPAAEDGRRPDHPARSSGTRPPSQSAKSKQPLAGELVEAVLGELAGDQHPGDVDGEDDRQCAGQEAGRHEPGTTQPGGAAYGLGDDRGGDVGGRHSWFLSDVVDVEPTLPRPASRTHRRNVLTVSRNDAESRPP